MNDLEEHQIQQLTLRVGAVEDKLQTVAETTKELITSIRTGSELAAVKIESKMAQVMVDLEALLRLVRDGNGKPALVLRTSNNEQNIERLEKLYNALDGQLSRMRESGDAARSDERKEELKGKWLLVTAIVVGVLNIAGVVLGILLK